MMALKRATRGTPLRCGIIVALIAGAVLACSEELSRTQAAELLRGHLEAVGPSVHHPDSFRVEVVEVLTSSDVLREVRFRAIFLGVDSAGMFAEDASRVLTAVLQRSDRGWALARYGEKMADYVALTLAAEWGHAYRGLLESVEELRSVASDWEIDRLEEATDADATDGYARFRRIWEDYERGIERSVLQALAEEKGIGVPEGAEWSIDRPLGSASILWARFVGDTLVTCATRLGAATKDNIRFWWVDHIGVTCRGRTPVVYNNATAVDSARSYIARNGYVLLDATDGARP